MPDKCESFGGNTRPARGNMRRTSSLEYRLDSVQPKGQRDEMERPGFSGRSFFFFGFFPFGKDAMNEYKKHTYSFEFTQLTAFSIMRLVDFLLPLSWIDIPCNCR